MKNISSPGSPSLQSTSPGARSSPWRAPTMSVRNEISAPSKAGMEAIISRHKWSLSSVRSGLESLLMTWFALSPCVRDHCTLKWLTMRFCKSRGTSFVSRKSFRSLTWWKRCASAVLSFATRSSITAMMYVKLIPPRMAHSTTYSVSSPVISNVGKSPKPIVELSEMPYIKLKTYCASTFSSNKPLRTTHVWSLKFSIRATAKKPQLIQCVKRRYQPMIWISLARMLCMRDSSVSETRCPTLRKRTRPNILNTRAATFSPEPNPASIRRPELVPSMAHATASSGSDERSSPARYGHHA
mmetsp:Transcript_27011/g.88650  ORF Transcript_27011/g.88650 Transcript_27011/m.88650 type:complete len:298 (-) Transcript_27011:556-1449(-)